VTAAAKLPTEVVLVVREGNPMGPLKIALLEALPSAWDREANLAKGEALCRGAREMAADIALLPEMWSTGYEFPGVPEAGSLSGWQTRTAPSDGPFIQHSCGLVRELKIAITLTYLKQRRDRPSGCGTCSSE
jgi:predicted amidohydrolase